MAKVIASVINDLETDQRVHKVCTTVMRMGHDVILVGRLTSKSGTLNRDYLTERMRLIFSKGPLFYLEYNVRLFIKLLFTKADILISNDLDTLLANFLASKVKGLPLLYDSHEYFTEVPELEGRFAKKIWLRLEQMIMPRLTHVMTVNESLANIYSDKYQLEVQWIRNLPLSIDEENQQERAYLLYQGAINEGRGLEQLITAMKEIDFPLLLVGNGDIREKILHLIAQNELSAKVKLLDRLQPETLRLMTQKAKIGFNLLDGSSLNYKYSLANKFFDFIQSEVPVITMKFPEYERIFRYFDVGIMLDSLNPESIVKAVNELMVPEVYHAKIEQIRLAKKEFIWEKEEPKLKRIFAKF